MEFLQTPPTWLRVKLVDIASLNMGQSPSSLDVNNSGVGIAFFQGKAEFGKLHPTTRKYCTSPKKIAEPGDILLSVRAPVGPTNVANQRTAIGRGLAAIKAEKDAVDPRCLLYYFRCIEPWMSQQGTGTTFKAVSSAFLKELNAILPPLAEQKVIADKLATLLAQAENTKARLERIPQILKRFRQSVLAAAVSGRLTEEWSKDSNAPGWSEVALDSICRSISDGDHQAPPRANDGIPFLVISNVTSGQIDFRGVSRWVPDDYYASLKDVRKPEKNDLLYTVTGSFGIPAVVKTDQPFCFQRHIAIIKANRDIVSVHYLAIYLRSPEALYHAESVATGTAQKTVSLTNLRKFPISLPSIDEQTEIARRTDQLLACADHIEQRVNNALARVNNLTQSILAKAFRGELTEQWRKDNPELISGENSAEALLERIKSERAAQKPAGRQSKKRKSESPAT